MAGCLGMFLISDNKADAYTMKEVIVQENQTVWDIAAENVSDDTDIRDYMGDIIEDNHLSKSDADIYPGQRLVVRVK